jgi:hypothetical protein
VGQKGRKGNVIVVGIGRTSRRRTWRKMKVTLDRKGKEM